MDLGSEALKLSVQKVERGGAIVQYQVAIGKFLVNVLMLNISEEAPIFTKGYLSRNNATEIVAVEPGNINSILAKRMMFDYTTTKCKDQQKIISII